MDRQKLAVIVPTRERPELFKRAAESVLDTAKGDVTVYGVVDYNDPMMPKYLGVGTWKPSRIIILVHPDSGSSNKAIDWAWRQIDFDAILTIGDDGMVRTVGWDTMAWLEFNKDPMVMLSPNDGRNRKKLELVFCTKHWLDAVGFLMDPVFEHFCADEHVERIAQGAGKLRIAKHIIVEHMHPKYGKGEWDAVYRSKRTGGGNDRDRARLAGMDAQIMEMSKRVLEHEKILKVAQHA